MSLKPIMPWLILALAASVAAMTYAAARGSGFGLIFGGLAFTAAIVAAGLAINEPLWRGAALGPAFGGRIGAMRRNIRLAMLVYAWGAAAFFAVYTLSGKWWLHAYQYGGGAAVISGALLLYVHALGNENAREPHPALTIAHGLAIAGGLVYLLATSPHLSRRPEWPAEMIFLLGGLALIGLCLITALTQRRMGRA